MWAMAETIKEAEARGPAALALAEREVESLKMFSPLPRS